MLMVWQCRALAAATAQRDFHFLVGRIEFSIGLCQNVNSGSFSHFYPCGDIGQRAFRKIERCRQRVGVVGHQNRNLCCLGQMAGHGHRYNRPVLGNIGGRKTDFIARSDEHTSELLSLMRISYAVLCLNHKEREWTSDCGYHVYANGCDDERELYPSTSSL